MNARKGTMSKEIFQTVIKVNIHVPVSFDGIQDYLLVSGSMVRRYPPNPRGTKNVFSDIRVLSIQIYVLSL